MRSSPDWQAELAKKLVGNDPRGHWEAYANLLGLSAIDARDGAEVVRDAADLDKSVKDLAAEGKLDATWDDAPAPDGLTVTSRGSADDADSQVLSVTMDAPSSPLLLAALGAATVLLVLLALFTLSFAPLMGALFAGGIAAALYVAEKKMPREVHIDRRELRYTNPIRTRTGFTMPLAEIEAVYLRDIHRMRMMGNMPNLAGQKMIIASDRSEQGIGEGLPAGELLTAEYTFVDQPLADLYGIGETVPAGEMKQVEDLWQVLL